MWAEIFLHSHEKENVRRYKRHCIGPKAFGKLQARQHDTKRQKSQRALVRH